MKEYTINSIIVYMANQFIGQKEIKGNQGFENDRFERLMEDVGWETGQAWCAYFAELIWELAYSQYDSFTISELQKLFSAGAVRTWNNFKKSEFVCDQHPEAGAVVIWQNYKSGHPHWTGHAGICINWYSESDLMTTVEGNTNSQGGREGIEVAERIRPIDFTPKKNGLTLLGFIHPKEV